MEQNIDKAEKYMYIDLYQSRKQKVICLSVEREIASDN